MDSHENFVFAPSENAIPAGSWTRLRRHTKMLSFLACVALPAAGTAGYEYGLAADQYVSTTKFILRPQAPQVAEPATLSAELAGGNPMLALIEDSEVVVQYIGSGQILADLPRSVSLERIYATSDADWFARLGRNLPPERQLPYWKAMVQPSFDLSSGIVTVKVRAFRAADAALVAQTVLGRAQALVDGMSAAAQQNALSYAQQTATAAQQKLAQDEAALAAYRNRYAILFPELNAQQSSSVGGDLLLGLAQDKAMLAALRAQGQGYGSQQVQTLLARISSEQVQADAVQAELATANGGNVQTLADVMTGYDGLVEAQTLDGQLYASDLLALQNARNMAAEKSLYLESFVQPAVPESSTYPVRWLVTAEAALAGFIAWILLTLVANIIRDQLD